MTVTVDSWVFVAIGWVIGTLLILRLTKTTGDWDLLSPVFRFGGILVWSLVAVIVILAMR